jgi:5-(carboxyamino)imidazole ribonucleotide synthase
MFDIGFLGGGQLARMSIMAAQKMGLRCLSLESGETTSASRVAGYVNGEWRSVAEVAKLMAVSKFITLENEFVPANVIEEAAAEVGFDLNHVIPGPGVLRIIQDKLLQRQSFADAGLKGPSFGEVPSDSSLVALPVVFKSRYGGYDGKGTHVVRTAGELEDVWPTVSQGGWMMESFAPFRREVATMVLVSQSGETQVFPPVVTLQPNAVCEFTIPYKDPMGMVLAAETALEAVRAIGGVGLFGVEMFEMPAPYGVEMWMNEIAPRPHNTGHYSLDWADISQFEAHIRVVTGMPLPRITETPGGMANLLGPARNGSANLDGARRRTYEVEPSARIHWYDKEVKPGRKVGHINLPFDHDEERLLARLRAVRDAFWSGYVS